MYGTRMLQFVKESNIFSERKKSDLMDFYPGLV